MDTDITTPLGFMLAKRSIRAPNTLLWASMPEAGGSPFQDKAHKSPKGDARLRTYRRKFWAVWKSFKLLATECLENGGSVAIQWPKNCSYWKSAPVRNFLQKHSMENVVYNGCAVGMVASDGTPSKTSYTVSSTEPRVLEALGTSQCCGGHSHKRTSIKKEVIS